MSQISHPPPHPHKSVHFKLCNLQRQRFVQLLLHLHLMSSLHAIEASGKVIQIGCMPVLLIFHPQSFRLISLNHFKFASHHIL